MKAIAHKVDAFIVVGSPNSSNSLRLKEVAERYGCPHAQLVLRASDIDWAPLAGIKSLGVTAGASAPEILVEEILDAFSEKFELSLNTVTTATEDVSFPLPRALREKAAAGRASLNVDAKARQTRLAGFFSGSPATIATAPSIARTAPAGATPPGTAPIIRPPEAAIGTADPARLFDLGGGLTVAQDGLIESGRGSGKRQRRSVAAGRARPVAATTSATPRACFKFNMAGSCFGIVLSTGAILRRAP